MPLNRNKIFKQISVGILHVSFTTSPHYARRINVLLLPTVSLCLYVYCMHVVNDVMFNDEIWTKIVTCWNFSLSKCVFYVNCFTISLSFPHY